MTPEGLKGISKAINQSVSQTVMDRQSSIMDLRDGNVKKAQSVARDMDVTPQQKSAAFSELSNEQIARHTKDIAVPTIQTTLSQFTKGDVSVRDKLLRELESTKGSHQALQSFLRTHKDDIEKLVAANGEQGVALRSVVEKVS